MDDIQDKGPVLEPEKSDLEQQLDSLRHLVTSVLILLLVVSGTFNIFLLRQYRSTAKDLDRFRPFAANVINGYSHNEGPAIESFVRSALEFGKTHKDYEQILAKYGLKQGSVPPPQNMPAATPAPGLTAPKK
jgi:hypothetical protein